MQQLWRVAGERLTQAAAISRRYHTIQAIPREVSGSRVSDRDRAQGRVPAVVFSQTSLQQPTDKILITAERKQIHSILKSVGPEFFCSTTFSLQVRAGSGSSVLLQTRNVLPIKLHRDLETGKVLNVVFVWAEDGLKLEVDVPVVLKGITSCPGLKKGGKLSFIRKDLKFLCPAESIPQKIEVDISNLDIGERISMNDIQVDPSLKLVNNNPEPICKIVNVKSCKPVEA